MRSLFLITLLIGLALNGVSYALNAASVQGGNPDNWYTEVKYEAGTDSGSLTAEHGNTLAWDTTAHDGYTVIKINAADAENVAGVVPSGTDYSHNLDSLGRPLKDGDVFLMQIHGYHQNMPTDGNVVVNQGIGSEANWGNAVGDGDGMGVALETDGADTSSPSGYSADVYLNIQGDID